MSGRTETLDVHVEEKEPISPRDAKHDDDDDDDDYAEYKLKDRSCLCGFGAVKWYFCEFKCDSSHQIFSVYIFMLLATWGIYYLGFHTDHVGYAMLAGSLIGILMGFYAIPKIENLYKMRKSLQKLVRANIQLKKSNKTFKSNVEAVKSAQRQVGEIQDGINGSNVKLKSAYKRFGDYGAKLNQRNVDNIEQLKKLQYYFEECRDNYRALLTRAEKTMLNAKYREIQNSDGKAGLSKEEFHEFVNKIPKHFRKRFHPLDETFRKYAGDDMNMDYAEFQIMIRNMAWSEY